MNTQAGSSWNGLVGGMEWGKPSFCLNLSNVFGLVSKENTAYSVTQSTHICLFTCFRATPISIYAPSWYFLPISWFQPHLKKKKKNLHFLTIITVPVVVQKLAEKNDSNVFPCWWDGGQSSTGAAAVKSAPTYRPMQLAFTVSLFSYRAHRLLDTVELTEEAGLSRWESTGDLG